MFCTELCENTFDEITYTKSTALSPFLRPSLSHEFLRGFSKKLISFMTATSSFVEVGLLGISDEKLKCSINQMNKKPIPTMLNQLIIHCYFEQLNKRGQLFLRIRSTQQLVLLASMISRHAIDKVL